MSLARARRDWNDYNSELSAWANDNQREARIDGWAFWALKIPAIVASASAGIWAEFRWPTVSLITGAIAAVCIGVDGIYPRGNLRGVHWKAYYDIRNLMNGMVGELRSAPAETPDLIRKIIRESQPERDRIFRYLRDASAQPFSKP